MFMRKEISVTLKTHIGYVNHTVDPIRDSNLLVLYRRVLKGEMTVEEGYEIYTKATEWLANISSNIETTTSEDCLGDEEEVVYKISI